MSLCAGNGQLSEACLHLGAGSDVTKRRKQERPEKRGPGTPAMLPSLHRRGATDQGPTVSVVVFGTGERDPHTSVAMCGASGFFLEEFVMNN